MNDDDNKLRKIVREEIEKYFKEGFKVGEHSIYLRPSYIDMNSNEFRNVAGGSSSTTYYISKSGSTYYAKNSATGAVTSNSVFTTLFNNIVGSMTTGGVLTIKDGTFVITSPGLSMNNNVSVFCTKGTILQLGYNGIAINFYNTHDARLSDANIYGLKGSYSSGRGIYFSGNSYRNKVSNNYINSFGTKGIHIYGSGCTYNIISDNTVYDVNEEGIMIAYSNHNTVKNNKVEITGNHGIVSTGGSYNIIDANDVSAAGQNHVSGWAHGIAVDGNGGSNPCFGDKITNNIVNGTYHAGIEVADQANKCVISKNLVENSGTFGGNMYGIYFGGGMDESYECAISDNVIRDSAAEGIYIGGSSGNLTNKVTMTNNVVTGCSLDGIKIEYCDNINVQNNVVQLNGGYGFRITQSTGVDYVIVTGNNFLNNTLGSTFVTGSNSNGLVDNNLV